MIFEIIVAFLNIAENEWQKKPEWAKFQERTSPSR